ncbi:MAG: transporter, partial [Ignavibacteria bacterium]|nr:transporter [Ignavibacteria bacterium]
MKKKLNFICLLLGFVCSPIFGQTTIPELITDRPDVTESAVAVPVGSFQVESGFSFQQQKFTEFGVTIENRSISLFSTLFRYGVLPNLEFRFGGEYLSNKASIDQFTSPVHGANDLMIGSKFALRKEEAF